MIHLHKAFADSVGVLELELLANIFEVKVDVVAGLVIREHLAIAVEDSAPGGWSADGAIRLDAEGTFVFMA